MRLFHRLAITVRLFLALFLISAGFAQERDRSKIPDQYKWNLADLYPNAAAWSAAKERITAEIPKLKAFEGKLASSPAALADALDLAFRLDKEISRVGVYANTLSDEDTRASGPQGMVQETQQLAAAYGAARSFLEPEVLKAGSAVLDKFLAGEPRLKIYDFYLKDLTRRQAHTLSDKEEKILADATPLVASPGNIFNIFTNADFPYPSVTLSNGKTVKIDQAGYNEHRASPNRSDREKAMSTYFNALGGFSRTYGTTMSANVQKALFLAKARHYPTNLEASLDGANIPVSVYTRLIDGINKNLPSFHRYLKLRKRMLALDQLHYYDLYAPLVSAADQTYSPEEAQKHILAALAPLGSDYVSVVQRAFNERWIDWYPSEGKSFGAYQTGAYDVHPFILANYLGKYRDVGTIAHELGHAMQTYYSDKTQPYALANYPIFVAEVASTFNEALLIDHMLKQIKDDSVKLSLLGDYLEGFKATVFRQAQFAEFELRMHEKAQSNLPLTGEVLAKLYSDITKKYYGHDQGVCIVDDYVQHEWSLIPHFYGIFYVFQYATSFTASSALSEKVLAGDAAARKRYLAFLASGGSQYPIELLKEAGIDMTTDEPLELTMKKMNRIMDEMEQILAKLPAKK